MKQAFLIEAEKDTTTKMPYRELRDMVVAAYELEDVLNEYGVFPDNLGKSTCPQMLKFRIYTDVICSNR